MSWSTSMAELSAALSMLGDVPMSCLDQNEAVNVLTELHTVRARLDAVIARVSADPYSPLGATGHSRSVATVIAAATRANPRRIRAEIGLGSWLGCYPLLAEALEAGRISADHVRAIRCRENPRTRPHLDDAQGYLIEAAETCQWAEFVAALRYWELAADPDGEEPRTQARNRSCSYRREVDGSVSGRFILDPISGQCFVDALERQTQRLFREDAETDRSRSVGQRRADALVLLISSGGSMPTRAPLVHLVMSQKVVEGGPTDPHSIDGRCEFVDGTPLHPKLGFEVLAGAEFRRMVLSPTGEQLDLGRRVRAFPSYLRQALLVAARGRCQERGCDAPVSWLQTDHVMPWSRGGVTAWSNGQMLCDPHNKRKRDRWPIAT